MVGPKWGTRSGVELQFKVNISDIVVLLFPHCSALSYLLVCMSDLDPLFDTCVLFIFWVATI